MKDLKGKVAIVTGAGRGIGRGIATRFAKEGASVVVASRSQDTVDSVTDELHDLGAKAIGITVDVADESQVKSMVKRTVEEFDTVDILVNNAQGFAKNGPFETIEESEWDLAYQTGFKGTLYGMQAVVPIMKEKHYGRIINFGSPMSMKGHPFMAPYHTAKGAITYLSLTAAHELAPYGITVNTILPSVLTDAMRKAHPDDLEDVLKTTPMGRLGDPEEDAGALAAFLASDDASYLTGLDIFLDGGFLH